MAKKVIQERITEAFNHETGEVEKTTRETVYNIPGEEPAYVKVYLQDIELLYSLPDSSHRVLFELLKRLDFEGNINLNSTNKKAIINAVGWKSIGVLDNYLSNHLIKKGIFKREGTGVYLPNPHLFGRGKWTEIKNRREAWLHVTYNEDGERKITSSLNDKDTEKEQLEKAMKKIQKRIKEINKKKGD